MSGFNRVSNDRGKTGSSPRKPMGIQFVKSSETHQSQSTTNNSDSRPVSKSNGILPTPPQNFNASNSLGIKSSQPPTPCFGSPAVNFSPHTSNNSRSSELHSRYSQAFVKSGDSYSSLKGGVGHGQGYRMPGFSDLNKGASPSTSTSTVNFQKVTETKPLWSMEQYMKAWKEEKDTMLNKLRKLAYEVVTLKSDRPNAKDKLHSAANRVPLRIEFNTQPVLGAKNSRSFLCYVYIENISIASGQGAKIKDSKTNAYEAALQKILMPFMRVIPTDPTSKELQVSKQPFTSPPPKPSKVSLHNPITDGPKEVTASQHKESNLEAAGLKRRYNEYKPLDDFVIVEPKVPIPDCTPAHTLRRSADFNHMLLEYEYFFKGEAARCVLKIENEILADVNGISKVAAKNNASAHALLHLKKFCWIIKTKQAVDSNTKISKEEIVNELNEQSESIDNDNIGNKMLRKMGWSGGGVGKDGSGIAEPVSLKSVLNREGLGLSESKGITSEFRRRIKEVIENYAASNNQEDLVFSSDFRLEERQIIHDECRRLNLRSKSRGKGVKRYLCVRRKRSVNQLFDHLMEVGGETLRYQLVPPGQDDVSNNPDQSSQLLSNPSKSQTGSGLLGSASSHSQPLLGNVPNWQAGNQFILQQSDQKIGIGNGPDSGNSSIKMTPHGSGNSFGGGNQTSGSQSQYNTEQNRLGPNVHQQGQYFTREVGKGNFRSNLGPLLLQTRSNPIGLMTQQSGNNDNSHFGNSFRDSGPQGQTALRNDPNSEFQNCGSRMGMGSFSFGNNSSSNSFNFNGIAKGRGEDGEQWMRPPRAEFGSNNVSGGRMLPPKQQPNSMKQEGPIGNSYNNDSGTMMNSSGAMMNSSGGGFNGGNQMIRNGTGFGNDQGQGFYVNNPDHTMQRAGGSGGMMGNHGWNSDSSGQWGMMGQQSDGSGGSMMGGFGHGGGMQQQQYPNQGYSNWDGGYR